ncbi:MAG: NADH-ubiquinone oxidoreductase chain M [Cytophagales bacterium]|jgi:NADH-quinone oxidoreductase subunit M|nr:NADH-quinone oxidoreductase subunit M [Bacteroidota bacterium]MBS1981622.1 NADH-quinone oxidoreductase subunit M [Bacteroidota bacterium]WHZ08930.1 MAG: NADH-ubiquinone oxidoreductase chain M [Cytophagales bacterium]
MLTIALIFVPLIAAVIVLGLPQLLARFFAFFAALVELLISLVVIFHFNKLQGVQFVFDTPWIQSMGINFSVGMDGISLLLVLLTTVLTPGILVTALRDSTKPSSYFSLILLMQSAMIGVFVAQDGFLFYLFWEIALIPIYFICLMWGGENRGRITLKFFIYTLTGSLLMLVAIVYLYYHTPAPHSFALQSLYEAGRSLSLPQQTMVFVGMFLAFAIKMPVFPVHTWQPDTYTTAPLQGTMLLSAIMLKMGIYGVIRWLIPMVPLAVKEWGMTAIIFSVIGIIYASAIALVQKDFKRLIAYSSIAHVGLISAGTLTLTSVGVQGAMIQMISHGVIVFGLFYIVEIISERTKTRELPKLGGIRNVAPLMASCFLVIMLGSVALPLTSGFVGEFLLINSLVQYKLWIGATAGLTIILGAVYMFKTFQKSMSGETNSTTAQVTDLSYHERLVLFPVVFLIVLIGIYPKPLLDISATAVNDLLSVFSHVSASAN